MSRSRKNHAKLVVTELDSRALPSVAYNALQHTVDIQGTAGADVYDCSQSVVGGMPTLTVHEGVGAGMVTHTFNLLLQPVVRINGDLLGGSDRLVCDPFLTIPLTASGGTGNDTIGGGAMADSISGNDDNDVLSGEGGDDVISGGNHNDNITGGDDEDTINGDDGPDTIFGGASDDTIQGFWGDDRIHGDDGDDRILGDIGHDRIWGDKGFDTINGGVDSNDTLYGGTQDDTIDGSSGNDRIFGDEGDDLLKGGENNDSINGGKGRDTLQGEAGADTLVGGDGNDDLDGGTQRDRLEGDGPGVFELCNDTLHGGDANDQLRGDGGMDLIFGDEGNDTAGGGTGDDRMYGNAGNDQINGDDGRDQLFGDMGRDTLNGGRNNDTLVSVDNDEIDRVIGGAGFDSFWVDKNGANQDTITDASANETETNVHLVDSFENGPDKTMDGDGIPDPSGGESSRSFAGKPLFSSSGPAVTDVDQGALGDCWLLASLATSVNITPNVARQLIVDLGDNTYGVQINNDFYRVDADLPVFAANPDLLQFAGFGADESIWVPLVEKAWAIHRNNDYSNIANDSPYFPLGKIGGVNRNLYHIAQGNNALSDIFVNGWAGVFCTRTNENRVHDTVASHCYAIISVNVDPVTGVPVSALLYNPHAQDNTPLWNADGTPVDLDGDGEQDRNALDGSDDGFVTLTIDQFANDAQEPIGVITADFSHFN